MIFKGWIAKGFTIALVVAVVGAAIAWRVAESRKERNAELARENAALVKQIEITNKRHAQTLDAMQRLGEKERGAYEFDKISAGEISQDEDGDAAPVLRNTVKRLHERQRARN